MKTWSVLTLVLLLAGLVCGCNGSSVKLVPVSGTVTFNGAPPPKTGMVTFTPIRVDEGLPNRPGTAHFDEQGHFKVTSFRQDDGLVPGTYHATITCWLGQPTSEDPGSFERLNVVPKDFRPDEVVVDASARRVHVEFDVPTRK